MTQHDLVDRLARPACPSVAAGEAALKDAARRQQRFRPGQENGTSAEQENIAMAEGRADNSPASNAGHLYASPTPRAKRDPPRALPCDPQRHRGGIARRLECQGSGYRQCGISSSGAALHQERPGSQPMARTQRPGRPRRLQPSRATPPENAHLEPGRKDCSPGNQTRNRQGPRLPEHRRALAPRLGRPRRNR